MFRFKQFAIEHDRASMRVGTDAVLLGAWVQLQGAATVLDVGTGCGVIALMAAQRTPQACRVHAIDIDEASVDEACVNFMRSPWRERLTAQLIDVNDYSPGQPCDVIVTNPPFFTEQVLPPDAVRSAARHTGTLTFDSLMQAAKRMLAPHGSIALITPVEARDAVTAAATFAGLSLQRLTTVCPRADRPPKRLLWQWAMQHCVTSRDTLTIHQHDGNYTPQYIAMCRDFYLHF